MNLFAKNEIKYQQEIKILRKGKKFNGKVNIGYQHDCWIDCGEFKTHSLAWNASAKRYNTKWKKNIEDGCEVLPLIEIPLI